MSGPAARLQLVLVPSPLLGPSSWSPLAEQLRRDGWETLISIDVSDALQRHPHWRRTVEGTAAVLRGVPDERPAVLIAHSGAGPLLAAAGASLPRPIAAYLFVDAGLPAAGRTRLEVIEADNPAFAAALRTALAAGGRFPTWSDAELAALVPDAMRRASLLAELRPRGLDYWTEPLPSVTGWPDAPCAYLLFSDAYRSAAAAARRAGWPVRHLPAGHLHHLVDPQAVSTAIGALLCDVGLPPPEAQAVAAGGVPA